MNIKTLSILLALPSLFFLQFSSALAATFGMSPPEIVNTSLKPGSDFVYVVNLSTNDTDSDMKVEVDVIGSPELKEWVSVKQEGLLLPKGKKRLPMYVQIRVPKEAQVGQYKGRISVALTPFNRGDETIAVRLGGFIQLDLNVVGDNITDYEIRSVSIDEVKPSEPILIHLKVHNRGNTAIENIPAELKVYDLDNNTLLKQGSLKKLQRSISPYVTDSSEMKWNVSGLVPGRYKVQYRFQNSDDTWYENSASLVIRGIKLDSNRSIIEKVEAKEDSNVAQNKEEMTSSYMQKFYQFLIGPWFLFGSLFLVLVISLFFTRLRH